MMKRIDDDDKREDEERTSLLLKKNTKNDDGNPENNAISSEEEEEEQYSYYYREEEDTEAEADVEENLIVETPPSANAFSSRKENFFSPNESDDWKKTKLSRMISTSKELLFCNASTLRVLLTVVFISGALLTGASYGSRFGGDLYLSLIHISEPTRPY